MIWHLDNFLIPFTICFLILKIHPFSCLKTHTFSSTLQEETPLFIAAREGGYETVKVLLDHYANRDMTDHMDRLPRDIAHEKQHHDIVKLLDSYKVATSVHLATGGVTSPQHHHMTSGGYMHPNGKPTKSKSRKKSTPNKDIALSASSPNGLPVTTTKSKPRKKKDSEGSSKRSPSQQQLTSPPQQPLPLSMSGHNSHSQTLMHHSSSDSSPMSTISPGSYSIDSHHSPVTPGYEMTSPGSQAGQGTVMSVLPMSVLSSGSHHHHLDDYQVMAGHYSSPTLGNGLDNLLDWNPSLHHKPPQHQFQTKQGQSLPPLSHAPNGQLSNGHLPGSNGSSNSPQCQVVNGGPATGAGMGPHGGNSSQMKVKNLPMSPTHMQALQQHAQQRAQHGSPHHRNDFSNSFHQEISQPVATQIFNSAPMHNVIQQQSLQQQRSQQQHGYPQSLDQYPTPPSHNSQHMTDSPPQLHNTMTSFRPDHLPTPSPDSPGQWSSSSPHSPGQWSEGISSPIPPITHNTANLQRNKRMAEHAYF